MKIAGVKKKKTEIGDCLTQMTKSLQSVSDNTSMVL